MEAGELEIRDYYTERMFSGKLIREILKGLGYGS